MQALNPNAPTFFAPGNPAPANAPAAAPQPPAPQENFHPADALPPEIAPPQNRFVRSLSRQQSEPQIDQPPAQSTSQLSRPNPSANDSWARVSQLSRLGSMQALHSATTSGDTDLVAKQLAQGTPVDSPNNRGVTPLHFAAAMGKLEVLHQLVNAGADVNAAGQDGSTPLQTAIEFRQSKIVDHLLALGANPRTQSQTGESVLEQAARMEMHTTVDLLERLLNPSAGPRHAQEFTEFLAKLRDPSFAANLIRNRDAAFLNRQSPDGSTLLHYAVDQAETPLVRALLAAGASPNIVDAEGDTPLHHAALLGNRETYALLVQCGALESVRNNRQKTPTDLLAFAAQNPPHFNPQTMPRF